MIRRRSGWLAGAACLVLWAGSARADGTPRRLLDRVYFGSGATDLDDAAREVLGPVADLAAADPSCRLWLVGRTDSRGSAWANQRLAERRARAVADELARRGVDRSRVVIEPRGERPSDSEPEVDALLPGDRMARERRVDVFVQCEDGGADGG